MIKFRLTYTYKEAEIHALILSFWHRKPYGIYNWGFGRRFIAAPTDSPNVRQECLIRVVK